MINSFEPSSNSFSNLSNDFRLLKKRSIDLQNELNQSSTPKDVATMFSSSIDVRLTSTIYLVLTYLYICLVMCKQNKQARGEVQ